MSLNTRRQCFTIKFIAVQAVVASETASEAGPEEVSSAVLDVVTALNTADLAIIIEKGMLSAYFV